MNDPKFQAVWHEMNEAQVSLVHAHDEKDRDRRSRLLADAQVRAKRADVLLRELLSHRNP